MGGRAALLIGSDEYWLGAWEKLKFAESDCIKLREALCQARFGFTQDNIRVLTGKNAESKNQPFRHNLLYDGLFSPYMDESSDELDLFLFYYAGHGVELDGESYLVPVDGVMHSISDTCVSWKHILARMALVRARHKLVLLDICRKNPSSVRGASQGLDRSFFVPAENVGGMLILSACNVDEFAHECEAVGGGVYTHYWCEGLKGVVRGLNDGSLTAYDVQLYAERKTTQWVSRHPSDVKSSQTPQIIAANCSTIHLEQVDGDGVRELPRDVSDPASRTRIIVEVADRDLERLKQSHAAPPVDYCVRIRAALSSFAISENEQRENDADDEEHYQHLLLEERNKLCALFRAGAALKLLLSWNVRGYLAYKRASIGRMLDRMNRLKSFLEEILEDPELVKRAEVVHTPIVDRNLLFLGTDYFFEGRRLGMKSGFDVTDVISGTGEAQRAAIQREIDLFDIAFKIALDAYCQKRDLRVGPSLNGDLISAVIKDLEDDIRFGNDQAAKNGE